MTMEAENSLPLPAGDYAIVELLGHRTLIGRVAEVERFGTKMLQVEPIFQGALLPPILHSGGSIYGFTPCTAEVAAQRAPKEAWQLPGAIRATLPPALLPSPEPEIVVDHGDDDEERPF
ncbi:hypothetical protein GCM10007913_12160 [Devosia yakushimensis]|uniref:Uncharacterized protein n=1 Tax=Devosia yakushimensis TaxID=470028 RepID=A0ABQ5UBN7_9HYPH|nr:hypothetical protein [Devosia yakushimensis]GLQ09284.1 hypothetical protein GCM10007913_12160 [Devosia yakushimensis]